MSILQDKNFRGSVKLFFPFFLQSSYMRRTYGMDPTPTWYDPSSLVARLLFAFVRFLPYGLVADPVIRGGGIEKPKSESLLFVRIPIDINDKSSLSDELVEDVHRRVLAAFYPSASGRQGNAGVKDEPNG